MTATVSERFEEVNIQRSEGPTAGSTEPSQLGRVGGGGTCLRQDYRQRQRKSINNRRKLPGADFEFSNE